MRVKLLAEMGVEKARDLGQCFLRFWSVRIEFVLGVRHTLKHLQLDSHTSSRNLRCARIVLLRNKSRVPLVKIAGRNPWKSP